MKNKALIYFYAIVIAIILAFAASLKFGVQHEKFPADCDEFGYLNMAKAMSNNLTFKDHTNRTFLSGLIEEFEANNINPLDYVWMIVPHAYHISDKTNNKVINQYPPGTSFVMSFIPIDYRKNAFPLLVILFTFLIPFILISLLKKENYLVILFLTLLMVIFTISTPFITEFARVNSLALTFGLFIAAGYTAYKNPFLALFLIALAANFRVVNLLMIVPLSFFFFPFIYPLLIEKQWKNLLLFCSKSFFILLLGISPYLFYITNLLGNPFMPTHPSHDTAFINFKDIYSNITFYFNFNESWFIAHLFIITILIILFIKKQFSFSYLMKWLSFAVVNYLFFCFHKIQMSYYPFASVFILLGAILYYVNDKEFSFQKNVIFKLLPLIISIVLLIDGIVRYSKKEHTTFKNEMNFYSQLCEYDIVWGEMHCGTAEYACNNAGFKYNFGSIQAKKTALHFLKMKKYKQVIILADLNMSLEELSNELNSFEIEYEIKETIELGTLVII